MPADTLNAVQTTVRIPRTLLARAHDQWGESTQDLSLAQLVRYGFARGLGATDAEALAATRDTRIGTTRKPTTT